MTVSLTNSKAVYQGIKDAGIFSLSALPETWLVYLLQMADDDPQMSLVEVAKEEEAIGTEEDDDEEPEEEDEAVETGALNPGKPAMMAAWDLVDMGEPKLFAPPRPRDLEFLGVLALECN